MRHCPGSLCSLPLLSLPGLLLVFSFATRGHFMCAFKFKANFNIPACRLLALKVHLYIFHRVNTHHVLCSNLHGLNKVPETYILSIGKHRVNLPASQTEPKLSGEKCVYGLNCKLKSSTAKHDGQYYNYGPINNNNKDKVRIFLGCGFFSSTRCDEGRRQCVSEVYDGL